MPIWDHLSLVSKETIFRRCTNFLLILVIFATFENHFLRINPKKLDDRVIHENDGMFPSNCQSWVTKTGSWITLWSFFGELSSENVFQKLQKSLKLVHLQKIVSLETRLRWSQMGIRRLQRAILSNGPHLGSLQWG